MTLRLDHLVIVARELGEGVAWLESRLGVPMAGGGKHVAMGTHNRLLSLGPGRYIEVIAVDPETPDPGRPRWFDMDAASMRERIVKGPVLATWAVRSDDIDSTVLALGGGKPEILPMSRGAYRWRIGVPPSGALAQAGTSPTAIQWDTEHPTAALPDSGCRLEKLLLVHPDAPASLAALVAAGLDPADPVEARREDPPGLQAQVRTPHGIVPIRG